MGKSGIDANINTEIFRKDFPQVIALRRDLAQLSPVRLALDSVNPYIAGQVLARNTATGLFHKYSAVSGEYEASCVLFESVSVEDQAASGGSLARGIFKGILFTDKLIDYVAAVKTSLGARDYTDASSTNLTTF